MANPVARILTLCAPMPNRNTETEILEDKRDGFIPLPGKRGKHSRLVPQELCPPSWGITGVLIGGAHSRK